MTSAPAITIHNRTEPLKGYSLDLVDLRSLLRRLRELGVESRTRELLQLRARQDISAEDKVTIEEALSKIDPVWISIRGSRGEHLFLADAADFLEEELPKEIQSVFAGNINPYRKTFNRDPDLAFEFNLDFSDPLILDWQNPVSGPTQNASYVMAKGDQIWTSAVIKTVEEQLSACRNRRRFFHRSFVYDLGLTLFGMPLAFLATKRLEPLITDLLGPDISTLSVMAYVYVFFLTIWLYRLLFSYMRWVVPLNEIAVNARRRAPHRWLLTALFLAVIGEAVHSAFVIAASS